ncbi:MAG: fused histidine kinase with domain/SpoIIE-like protein [Marmoricola sp.]|nr:fused histidine kinase with domain/SpoIIE-like protein [Marmoricola sp.]
MTGDLASVQTTIEAVRDVMASHTATLLLLDGSGSVLEPAASAGMGRRWRGATHVRVGSGFAGRVAATQAPVILHEVNERSVLNPILRDAGVRHLVGVPVFGTHDLLGVLHVGYRDDRAFEPEDVARLATLASELGQRLSERTEDDSHLAALALQRSLLPAAPPDVDGLDIAVRYLPAEGDLGGDWYDLFALPDGRVAVVMGDVEGHGLRSAVVMGRLRSALRAYALDYDDPAEVLQRLDRKLCYFESDITATVAYAVLEPPFDRVSLCIAGHPLPLIASREAPPRPVDLVPGLLLGFESRYVRTTETIQLPPGGVLALYTDGLVERRLQGRSCGDPLGDRLGDVMRSISPDQDAETICSRVIATGLGDDSVEDDVALVVIRRT